MLRLGCEGWATRPGGGSEVGPLDLIVVGVAVGAYELGKNRAAIKAAASSAAATVTTMFSKGSREQAQIKEVAREKGIKNWRALGDAVEKFKKGEGRGGADNPSLDEIRQIADELKAGGWGGDH